MHLYSLYSLSLAKSRASKKFKQFSLFYLYMQIYLSLNNIKIMKRLLGAFVELRKAAFISSCLSTRPSVRMKKLARKFQFH
jgi:hypothetical protein